MKVYTTDEFKKLIAQNPNGGIVFAESNEFGERTDELHVTNGLFGATCVVPEDGEAYSYDWNINEFTNDYYFVVYDREDILLMVKTLTSGLKND